MYLFPLIVSLAVLNAAASSSQTFVDTFEDKPAAPIQLGTGKPVGIENGLFYDGFVVGTDLLGVGGGIKAQSQPNVAAGGGATGTSGTFTITVDYPSSKVKSFDLLETYYGCSVQTATNVGVAQGCVLGATGFYANGTRFSTQALAFGYPFPVTGATGAVAQPMQRFVYLGLWGIKNVTIYFASSASAEAVSYYQLDNVKHTNYYW